MRTDRLHALAGFNVLSMVPLFAVLAHYAAVHVDPGARFVAGLWAMLIGAMLLANLRLLGAGTAAPNRRRGER